MAYLTCRSNGSYERLTGATIPPRRLFMVPLIAAAVLGVSQPVANAGTDPPGPDTYCVRAAESDACEIFRFGSHFAFRLPGIADDLFFIPDGLFVHSPEESRLTGEITTGGTPSIRFSVVIDMSNPVSPPPNPVAQNLDAVCYFNQGDPSNWTAFTTWSGELVGLPGSIYDGARYSITPRTSISDIQWGQSASDKNVRLGMAGKFVFALANPAAHPTLPVGPLDGIFNVNTVPSVSFFGGIVPCIPPAEPDLTGTWTGTIDCVGFDAEVNLSAEPVETFFSAATLEIGRSTNLLDVGDQYSVRLTRETGNSQAFCAYAPNNPGSTTGGQGVLVEPQRQATRVYFKCEGETLKARELIADGLHGTQLCKWSFTRTSTTPPTVADACSPESCAIGPDLCDNNAVCGQGPGCGGSSHTCTCSDGFVGTGLSFQCQVAP